MGYGFRGRCGAPFVVSAGSCFSPVPAIAQSREDRYTGTEAVMGEYVILTNKKRALIALIHSVAFMLIALRGVLAPSRTSGLVSALQTNVGFVGAGAITALFLIVTSILIWLFALSGCLREKLYFGLCATSAGTGLLRALIGDPPFHAGQYIRVVLLLCAVAVGTVILRAYDEPELSSE